MDCSHGLLTSTSILDRVRESEEEVTSALEHIRDSDEVLEKSQRMAGGYRPFATSAVTTFCAAQQLNSVLQYPSLSFQTFQKILEKLVKRYKQNRLLSSLSACDGHILHLKKELLLEVYCSLKVALFRRHHILFPLLVQLRQLLAEEEISERECFMLGEDFGTLLSVFGRLTEETAIRKPFWMSLMVC